MANCYTEDQVTTSTPLKHDSSAESLPPEYEEVAREEYPVAKKSIEEKFDVPGITISIDNDNVPCALDEEESDNSSEGSSNPLFSSFLRVHDSFSKFYQSNHSNLKLGLYILLAVGYFAYFIAAMILCATKEIKDPTPLVIMTTVVLGFIVIWFIKSRFGEDIARNTLQPLKESLTDRKKLLKTMKILLVLLMFASAVVIIITSVWDRPRSLISLAGYALFVFILFVSSAHHTKVNWRPVIGGFALQFFFATLILKWDVGYSVFKFLGDQVQVFLGFTNIGTAFVFGEKYTDHPFAMVVLPVIVFFSCAISVLYYIGAMQVVIGKIAWVMRVGLGTSAPESLCAAGNIFIGQTEAPILIRPFLSLMTKSELVAVMTGGFATIAGGVLAAYISFGVPAEHLLCASVMNAPCALAVAKLLYPETEKSQLNKASQANLEEKKERNILEAAAAGASSSIKLVANIAANLIAFLAMLEFVNAVLSWFGSFVGCPGFSFQMICSYVLMPVAYVMGVEWKDCGVMGELIGIKTFLNEFLAYKELSTYIQNRKSCVGTLLSVRTEVIATYALCGFSNLSSIGIQLGALGPMAPSRKGDLAHLVLRALLGGVVACLMTACIAGLLVSESELPVSICSGLVNATQTFNVSLPSLQNVTSYNVTV